MVDAKVCACACVRDSGEVASGGAESTRFSILAHDNYVTGETIADFSNEAHGADEGSGAIACGGAQETSHVLLHVRANGDSPVSWR